MPENKPVQNFQPPITYLPDGSVLLRISTSVPIPQPPPKPLFSWGNWLKGAGDWLKGAGDWVWGILEGDFNENPSNSQIIARLLVTLIPGIDTAGDVQDLAAALFKLIWQKRFGEVGVWTDLVLTGIGFIPEFGSVFKGVFKLILKEGTKFEDIAKYLKHLGIDDAAGWLRKLSNNLDQYGDMIKKELTHQLDVLSNFLQEFKKSLSPEQAAKIDELLKQIDEAKKRLPEEVDKVIAELKRRIDEILGENKTGVTIRRKELRGLSDTELRKLSKKGDKHATYEKNRRKVEKARQSGDSSSIKDAHGAEIENKIADELGDNVVKAGEEVEYPNPNNPNRTLKSEIDLETDTEVIQIKSGKDLPEPRQIQTTIYHAEQVGKEPVVYYNESTVPLRAVQEFEKTYPKVKLVPRTDF